MQEAPSVLHEAVKRELSGERVLWAGVPTRWGYVRKSVALITGSGNDHRQLPAKSGPAN